MIRPDSLFRSLVLGMIVLPLDSRAQDWPPIKLTIEAGEHDREWTPIRFELAENRFSPEVRKALDAGPVTLSVAYEKPGSSHGMLVQADRFQAGPRVLVTFPLPAPLAKGERARYDLHVGRPVIFGGDRAIGRLWTLDESTPGTLELKDEQRTVFRYNAAPVSSPNYKEIQNRDAYIHPAYSPSGALITGDFSPSHPHHRGFFLAYERTKTGNLTPDFWNIHVGTGKIYSEGVDGRVAGALTARFSARHRWEAKDKANGSSVVVLRERWDVEAYYIPGAPYWLFDVTSTQQAVDRPLEVLPYRYGGMAYRGPEPFVKGVLDVLTSEGKHRKDGDQKPARWVDLTGPVADGSGRYAGAMIADHPSNPHFPNVARIHPTTLPFFCFVPAHDKPLTIATGAPTVFRYRVLTHDGHPDPTLDERVARDFAEPPAVVVE